MSNDAFELFKRVKYLNQRVSKSSDEKILAEDNTLPALNLDDDIDCTDINAGAEMTNEDARTLWEAITLNLAFLLSKIKFENAD